MPKKRARGRLLISSRLVLESSYIQEIKIWEIPRSHRYPEGIRYRLVLVNPTTGQVALLYDNHWPKRDHVHEWTEERPYRFVSVEELLKDFFANVEEIERSER
jgi:hypothetical protein